MDVVVTVVDAALDSQFESVSQAAMVDLIVLSKTDLVSPADVESLETRLYGLNPGITIIRSILGKGLFGKLWGLSALHKNAIKQEALN